MSNSLGDGAETMIWRAASDMKPSSTAMSMNDNNES